MFAGAFLLLHTVLVVSLYQRLSRPSLFRNLASDKSCTICFCQQAAPELKALSGSLAKSKHTKRLWRCSAVDDLSCANHSCKAFLGTVSFGKSLLASLDVRQCRPSHSCDQLVRRERVSAETSMITRNTHELYLNAHTARYVCSVYIHQYTHSPLKLCCAC